MQITKQTSIGEAVIEITNGTASAILNGQSKGTSGIMNRLSKPVEKNGVIIVASICGIGLTADEAAQVEAALKVRDYTPASVNARESRALYAQTMREVRGDINQFAKGGAL